MSGQIKRKRFGARSENRITIIRGYWLRLSNDQPINSNKTGLNGFSLATCYTCAVESRKLVWQPIAGRLVVSRRLPVSISEL